MTESTNRAKPARPLWLRIVIYTAVALVSAPFVLVLWAWCIGAIIYSPLLPQSMRAGGGWVLLLAPIVGLVFLKKRRRTFVVFLATCLLILVAWTLLLRPSHDREWIPLHARLPHATFDGDLITLHDLRNFEYRSETDYTPRYYDQTFDLNEIESLDFVLSYWIKGGNIAHLLLSFGFEDGSYVCVSGETRLEAGEQWTSLGGFFKQYEFILVLGDERDLIGRRLVHSKNDVFVYPASFSTEEILDAFLEVVKRANDIHERPLFYNTIIHNCTTSLVPLVRSEKRKKELAERGRLHDIRILLNGLGDQMAYENGAINTELSFPEAREYFHVNQYVTKGVVGPDFSRRIRPHLEK